MKARNPYADIVVDTADLYDSSLSLDEECDRARKVWRAAMQAAGLPIGLGGFKQTVGEQGRILLAWFRGRDEQTYCVIFDPHNRKITNEPLTPGR